MRTSSMDELLQLTLRQDDLVERTIRFASLRGPDAKDFESVNNWLSDESSIVHGEREHLRNDHDFVALVEKEEEGWLDRTVERAVRYFLPREVRPSAKLVLFNSLTCSRAFLHRGANF